MVDLKNKIISMRREFHRIAEPGWLEFQTTVRILDYLASFGYNVKFGKAIHGSDRVGLVEQKKIDEYRNSLSIKADYDIYEILEGYTGAIATFDTGKEGPTIAIRFDIDANNIEETMDPDHTPNKEGFRSTNNFAMHACGHDGHIAIGLALAEWIIKEKDNLRGKFLLIFQPAEEGVRGAKSIVDSGVLADIDYLLAGHIGLGLKNGVMGVGTIGFLATTKLNIYFEGESAHAGASPEKGRNALLAAATCALNLHTLTQFSSGMSRLNVGVLKAGTSRNIVPGSAFMMLETRGENEKINEMLQLRVNEVTEGAAKAFNVKYNIETVGCAPAYNSYDKTLVDKVALYLSHKGFNTEKARSLGASEDVTFMMNEVEKNMGKSLHFIFGADLKAGHHNERFDFNEDVLYMAFDALRNTIELLAK